MIRIRHPSKTGEFITVPCGRCPACLNNKRKEWVFRLKQELRRSLTAEFVTLTYEGEKTYLSVDDVQKFLKRLRKQLKVKGLKYYLVGEYGTKTNRPHYHALFFHERRLRNLKDMIQKTWQKGFVHFGDVSGRSISYTTKYMLKKFLNLDKEFRPFLLCSKGLGKNYVEKKKSFHRVDPVNRGYVVDEGGVKQRMPRYYREKLFTKFEKELQNEKILSELYDSAANETAEIVRMKTSLQENYRRKQNRILFEKGKI